MEQAAQTTVRYQIRITGIVQGVGFRPFIYRLARKYALCGFTCNTAYGVYAEVQGTAENICAFSQAIRQTPPPLSRIDSVSSIAVPVKPEIDFRILPSKSGAHDALISPDIAICADCRREIMDPANRRFGYAFTNCTNCGPRFSILQETPYDRCNTTMAQFKQCETCAGEYHDPGNRRFHAQPNACAVCGPHLSFYLNGKMQPGDPIQNCSFLLQQGKIAAIKGIGGYHLACDALQSDAVRSLRQRKCRDEKPFAVMMRDIDTVRRFCFVSDQEEALLQSAAAPIVLLQKRKDTPLAQDVAPGQNRLGVMLPYTPLHCLLMQRHAVLVMTSANVSQQPMLFEDTSAWPFLLELSDGILTHDRPIQRRVDDSVCCVRAGNVQMIRRSRGYAPAPVPLPGSENCILALGGQQKNTFCLARNHHAFLSSHIGDLDDWQTEQDLQTQVQTFLHLFDAAPKQIVCDLHPDYVSTRFAEQLSDNALPLIRVQHHKAHFASVLAEHNLCEPAMGFIFDGTGYGEDGVIWGGELFFGTLTQTSRKGHLLPFPLLGGECAVKEPWRCAVAVLSTAVGAEEACAFFPARRREVELLLKAKAANINAPAVTSMGRLFDAVSALLGLHETVSYEGQAAIALEQLCEGSVSAAYPFPLCPQSDGTVLFDWRPMIAAIHRDLLHNVAKQTIAQRFHAAVIQLIADAAVWMRRNVNCHTVVLSGGCFQNEILLCQSTRQLTQLGFQVYTNEKVPVNDGGIAYGQAAIAAASEE